MKSKLLKLTQSEFVRNVALVATGTAAAQAITMAFAPLITRIYGPEAFGLMGIFMAIVTVAVPLAALAYPIAIVLPKKDEDALGLIKLSLILSVAIAIISAIALWAGGEWLIKTLGADTVSSYLILIPVAMLFAAWMQTAQQWLIRKKHFNVIARSAVIHSFILNSTKTGFGWLHPVGAVLIVLSTLSQVLHAALLFLGARQQNKTSTLGQKDGESSSTPLNVLAYRYRDFPIYRAPQNFINAASQAIPVLMLAAFFDPVSAGFYTLAYMVMGMPSTLIGKAVTDVFYPRITEAAYNGENIFRHVVMSTKSLFFIGFFPFLLVIVFGPWMFGVVFGEDWTVAGEYARWLALFFLFNFINKPCVAVVPVLGIQRGLLIYEILSTGGKALGLVIGFYWFGSDLWAVALFSIIGIVAYSLMMLWILSHVVRWKVNV